MGADGDAADLTVVIPTRERWPILDRTLAALRSQTVQGFDVVVAVDGDDQRPPALDGVRVVQQERAGPGAARNRAVRAVDRPLVLFLGDDMVPTPDLVRRHLDVHAAHPEPETAVLGLVRPHPDVAGSPVMRWVERSGTQFDFAGIVGDDAGWGRFYSCNVSLKRTFFLDAGGFDERFVFDYEDLDLAHRLHELGMRLRYEPRALAHHLHPHDLDTVLRRSETRARGERLMAAKHDWFQPYFLGRARRAAAERPASAIWPRLAARVPASVGPVARAVRAGEDRWYEQQAARRFLAVWEGEPDLEELQAYLGDDFDLDLLQGHAAALDREEEAAPDEATFYRTSRLYLYDLTAFAMSGTKRPYLADLRRVVAPGATVLDYGCGIGTDGLRLLADGYRVTFADFANPSTDYLRWRLARRGLDAPVYDLDADDVPGGFDAAISLDVIEHVEDPFAFLAELERRASIVMVNLLEPDPDDTHLHRPLPIDRILDHAATTGIVRYRRYHGRSHLVVYRTRRPGWRGRGRNLLERRTGRLRAGSV